MAITLCYLATVWGTHFFAAQPISLKLIFVPYVITSAIAVIALLFLVQQFYKTLDSSNQTMLPKSLLISTLTTRLTAYTLTTPKKLFSGNFIIPLLSGYVGIDKLALIKYASYVAESAHSIIKATIGFSGNALLSAVSQTKQHAKRIAFAFVSQKLATVLSAFICGIAFSLPTLFKLWEGTTTTQLTIIYTLLFLTLMMMDHLFLTYEQFYLMEHKAYLLLLIRGLELSLFYITVTLQQKNNTIFLLSILIAIRCLSFFSLAFHGFKTWKLVPYFAISSINIKRILIASCGASIITYLLLT